MVLARLMLCFLLAGSVVGADAPPTAAQVAAWVAKARADGIPPVFMVLRVDLTRDMKGVLIETKENFVPMSVEVWCTKYGEVTGNDLHRFQRAGYLTETIRWVLCWA